MDSFKWKVYDTLTPLGFFGTRRNFGVESREPNAFWDLKHKFKAAELAYLVAGAHHLMVEENKSASGLWKGFEVSRRSTFGSDGWKFGMSLKKGLIDMTFDSLTCLYQYFGVVPLLMIADVDGQFPNYYGEHGQQVLPEDIRTHVFIPAPFLKEHGKLGIPLSVIVQKYAETFGVQSTADFLRLRKEHPDLISRWDLPAKPTHSRYPGRIPLVPSPASPGSSHFIFQGRPRRFSPGASTDSNNDLSECFSPDDGDEIKVAPHAEYDEFHGTEEYDDWIEKIAPTGIFDVLEENTYLRRRINSLEAELGYLTAYFNCLEENQGLPTPRSNAPTSPIVPSTPPPSLPTSHAVSSTPQLPLASCDPPFLHRPSSTSAAGSEVHRRRSLTPTPTTRANSLGLSLESSILTSGTDNRQTRGRSMASSPCSKRSASRSTSIFSWPTSFGGSNFFDEEPVTEPRAIAEDLWQTLKNFKASSTDNLLVSKPGPLTIAYCNSLTELENSIPEDLSKLAVQLPPCDWENEVCSWVEVQEHCYVLLVLTFFDRFIVAPAALLS